MTAHDVLSCLSEYLFSDDSDAVKHAQAALADMLEEAGMAEPRFREESFRLYWIGEDAEYEIREALEEGETLEEAAEPFATCYSTRRELDAVLDVSCGERECYPDLESLASMMKARHGV